MGVKPSRFSLPLEACSVISGCYCLAQGWAHVENTKLDSSSASLGGVKDRPIIPVGCPIIDGFGHLT